MLLLGCPVLEILKLFRFFAIDSELDITSGLLKRLVLQSPLGYMGEIKICAPNLLELILNGNCYWRFRLMDVSSLVDADLSLCGEEVPDGYLEKVPDGYLENLEGMAVDYLEKLRHVQKLSLSCCYLRNVLPNLLSSFASFNCSRCQRWRVILCCWSAKV